MNRKLRVLTGLLILAAAPLRAANVERCVSTDAELGAALAEARDVPVTIRIVQGSYDLKNTVWHGTASYLDLVNPVRIRGGSRLLGGYTTACADRHITTFNTVLSDSAIVDATVGDGVQPTGDLTIEGLALGLRNGLSIFAGLPSNPIEPGATLNIRRNAFQNKPMGGLRVHWNRVDDGGAVIRVVENLVTGNTHAESQALLVAVKAGAPTVHIVNNTVVGNPGDAASTGLFVSNAPNGSARFLLFNNIAWNNAGGTRDLGSNTGSVRLFNNLVGSRVGTVPQFESATLSVDPELDGLFRPLQSPPSPVIDSGVRAVPGGLPAFDIDGDDRVTGIGVDRGAHESGVDFPMFQTVTTTNDSGTGSLRSAIAGVNASNGGTIRFAIGATCPRVITLASELPAITAAASIDGTMQSGSRLNTLDDGDDGQACIVLAAGAGVANGLIVAASSTQPVTIRGIGFSGFSGAAINMLGGHEAIVAGNRFGGTTAGVTLAPSAIGIRLGPSVVVATVGGDDAASRNFVGDATGSGIVVIGGANSNLVAGNWIGVGWDNGYVDRGNGNAGIYVDGPFNTVERNLVGFNDGPGILMVGGGDAHDNVVSRNFVGVDANNADLGNSGAGVRVFPNGGAAPKDNLYELGEIAFNGAGVVVDAGRGNEVRAVSIHNNTGLGIDLGTTGVDANDDDSGLHPVEEANRGQNYPVLSGGLGNTFSGSASGALTTTPGVYRVDLYSGVGCDASGNGEGRFFVGSSLVTVPTPQFGTQGVVTFTLPIAMPSGRSFATGSRVTATATDGLGNTSEFSACADYAFQAPIFADGFE